MLGVEIDNLTMDEALQQIARTVEDKCKCSFAFVNADCLNQATRNPAYARVLSRQAAVFADGQWHQVGSAYGVARRFVTM